MEDQDPPIDAHLRGKALQLAISYCAADIDDPSISYSAGAVVDIANKFYQFLKGDIK